MRKRPCSLFDFLPSPSVSSPSEVASGLRSFGSTDLRSFLPVMVPKKEERRRSFNPALVGLLVVVASAGESVTAVDVSAAGSTGLATLVSVFASLLSLTCDHHISC